MSASHADILIAGAGCAGLSLAVALVEAGVTDRSILLLDPRPTYHRRDRTWCFWDVADHPFQNCISHRWNRWTVTGGTGRAAGSCGRHAYCHIAADAFYAAAVERLGRSPNVELRLNCPVTDLHDQGTHVVAATTDGPVRADIAFDGRPRVTEPVRDWPADIWLRQRFVGLFVRTKSRTFDPSTVRLMDFRVTAGNGDIRFVYLLPFSPTQALVEATCITPAAVADSELELTASLYLHEQFGLDPPDWTANDREHGCLPMTTAPLAVRRSPRITAIGLAGGLAKPSTGYAFLAIQRWSAAMAARVVSAADPPVPPAVRSIRTNLLDRVFLSYLRHRPESAPGIFTRLFDAVDPDVLVRFLSDTGTVADDLRVAAALPKIPFLTEAVRSHRLWMPRWPATTPNRTGESPGGFPAGARATTV